MSFVLVCGIAGICIAGGATYYILSSSRKSSLRALEAARLLAGNAAIEFEYPGAVVDPGQPQSRGASVVLTTDCLLCVSHKGGSQTIARESIVRVSVHNAVGSELVYLAVTYPKDGNSEVLNLGLSPESMNQLQSAIEADLES